MSPLWHNMWLVSNSNIIFLKPAGFLFNFTVSVTRMQLIYGVPLSKNEATCHFHVYVNVICVVYHLKEDNIL